MQRTSKSRERSKSCSLRRSRDYLYRFLMTLFHLFPTLSPTTRAKPTEIDIKSNKGCEVGAVRKNFTLCPKRISFYDRIVRLLIPVIGRFHCMTEPTLLLLLTALLLTPPSTTYHPTLLLLLLTISVGFKRNLDLTSSF